MINDPRLLNASPKPHHQSVGDASTLDALGSQPVDTNTNSPIYTGLGLPGITGYMIQGELARGGMGRVLAGRELQLDREVAIKVLLSGFNANRFVTEAKITARLPHPSIPPVYALGYLADGSPYLAMKLVRGKTLADELKARPEPLHELPRFLQIFEQIAQAVGFAHSQGIIHRDLKPANIMVGAFGEVQVMDWGLAKEITNEHEDTSRKRERQTNDNESQSSTETVAWEAETPNQFGDATRSGAILGTPNYMAPEQARGEIVDARADVFALGGFLCSILTGNAVFGGNSVLETVKQAAAGDTSSALARLDACGAEAEVIQLTKHCLATNPADRPVNGQAVAKLVAEYRLSVEERLKQAETAKAEAQVRETEQGKRRTIWRALAIILLLGIATTSWLAWTTNLARNEAESAKLQAQANLSYAMRSNEILGSLFSGLDPKAIAESGRPLQDFLRERLQSAAHSLDSKLSASPETVGILQQRLGLCFHALGDYQEAIKQLEKAIVVYETVWGKQAESTIACKNQLVLSLRAFEDLQRATSLSEENLKTAVATLGDAHIITQDCLNSNSLVQQSIGNYKQAIIQFERLLQLQLQDTNRNMASIIQTRNNLGLCYRDAGLYKQFAEQMQIVYKWLINELGMKHPRTMMSASNLGLGYTSNGQADKAYPLFKEVLLFRKSFLGPDHPDTLVSMSNLAGCLSQLGQYEEALPIYQEAVQLQSVKLGVSHSTTLSTLNNLALAMKIVKGPKAALPIYEDVLRRTPHGENADTIITKVNIAVAYRDSGQYLKACNILGEQFMAAQRIWGIDHPQTVGVATNLALAQLLNKEYTIAEKLLCDILAVRQRLQPDHWTTSNTLSMLGGAYLGQKDYTQAEPLLLKGYAGLMQNEKKIPANAKVRLDEATDRLIQLYTETNKPEEVKKWQAEKAKLPESPKK